MGNPDRHGYYRILGVDPSASAEAVKKSFRQRSKDLHPDRNKRLGADTQFSALTEAYKVLSDPEARARYDTTGLDREAPGGGNTGRDVGTPVPCSRCKRVSAQPRYVIFYQVVGRLRSAAVDRIQGIYCARCARDVGMGATLMTWALGWWALDGPAKTVRALISNIKGGDMPGAPNHRLLAYQAVAFERAGKAQLARAIAGEALEMDPHGDHAGMASRIVHSGPEESLKNQWGTDPLALFGQLLPAIILIIGFVIFVPMGGKPDTQMAPPPRVAAPETRRTAPRVNPATLAHVIDNGAVLRVAPGQDQAALATLLRFENVTLLGQPVGGDKSGLWQRVRAADAEGYVAAGQLGKGPGSAALMAWCGDHPGPTPKSGTTVISHATGPHQLSAHNPLKQDALVKLKDRSGQTVSAFFLRAGERAEVPRLPEGTLSVFYATGTRYSTRCEVFLDDLKTYAHAAPLAFDSPIKDGTIYALNLGLTLSPDAAIAINPEKF